ncbi:hypothetical protein MKW98_006981 [Papaver atlanticum]|uniref:Neprosin PEP catalytic domain-containing protein n=1 Tax=Papaver atlanticum TaxID=357466 RepID=A0AAD4ST56_9MAGN|nr:hypothetical protein MKW98_006981 [Papaver atlanticum]
MASPLSLLLSVVWMILVYHHLVVKGRIAVVSSLSEQENLELEEQLKILNKQPIKTIHTQWGDLYDCIEFQKQPAFDHPLIKDQKILMNDETVSPKPHHKTSIFSLGDGCPKGTVPIHRTTKEDLIRAKSLSSSSSKEVLINVKSLTSSSSNAANHVYTGIYGATGAVNAWHPEVRQDQYSSAELSLKSGPFYQTNAVKFGWTVNPQLFGDDKTRIFTYWTGDGGHKTGCYNYHCPGFVQVHQTIGLGVPVAQTSVYSGQQFEVAIEISLEFETGKWWLILQDIKVGYWPKQLFPLFKPGAESIFWGGRVKAGDDGYSPQMASGMPIDDRANHAGYFADLKYKNEFNTLKPPERVDTIVDGPGPYDAKYYPKHNIVHFGGAYDGAECPN